MPRAAVRVQGAPIHTAWTLRGQQQEGGNNMQANGHYFDPQSPPAYESYDGSGYGSPGSSARSSARYSQNNSAIQFNKHPPVSLNATRTSSQGSSLPYVTPAPIDGPYDGFDFGPSLHEPDLQSPLTNIDDYKFPIPHSDQVKSHHISLNTHFHDQDHDHDAVGQHLLYENALLDTQSFKILDINRVDELKKERARLNQKIEAANRKLALESKVKGAAQNLRRLYSTNKQDGRPDTPQSPSSPGKHRSSLLAGRGRTASNGAQTLHQAEDEVAQSIQKVDELNEQLKSLLERRSAVDGALLQHTAAVLAIQAARSPDHSTHTLMNGHRGHDEDELHLPGPDEFDGIRDILRGQSAPADKQDVKRLQDQHDKELDAVREQSNRRREEDEQQLVSMQNRIENLNAQLRTVIDEAARARGRSAPPESLPRESHDPHERLAITLDIFERNMQTLDLDREEAMAHYARVQNSASQTRNDVEQQLERLNAQLFATLHLSTETDPVKDYRQPPQASGHGYQHQLDYLQSSLLAMGQLLQHHNEQLKLTRENGNRASREFEEAESTATRKLSEYEAVLAGLWDIISTEAPTGLTPRASFDNSNGARTSRGDRSPLSPLKEDFSLNAFSSRVQHMCNVASGAREQQDILRRQIQQQRDLNGRADMEKETEVADIQSKYDNLASDYEAVQQELANFMVRHQHAESESSQARNELANVMTELEQMRQAVEQTQARQKEIEQRHTQMSAASAQLSADKEAAEQRQADLQEEIKNQEAEVVRLMTELTMARAELDGAHGSRSERKKEAGVAVGEIEALQKLKDQEIEDLKTAQLQEVNTLRREFAERGKLLESELEDMTMEFQEMTRESLELEKEREKLESLIDSLRERTDELEAQLGDEKMKWMGIKSPNGSDPTAPRETTSVMVLRQEFKKMMREARAEGVRLLRIEQEERRKLEAELRRVRQSHTAMSRGAAAPSTTPALGVSGTTAPLPSRISSLANGVPSTPEQHLSPSIAANANNAATAASNGG